MLTVTCSPGSAQPQTGAGIPCCRTMWSLKIAAGLTSAPARGGIIIFARKAAGGEDELAGGEAGHGVGVLKGDDLAVALSADLRADRGLRNVGVADELA